MTNIIFPFEYICHEEDDSQCENIQGFLPLQDFTDRHKHLTNPYHINNLSISLKDAHQEIIKYANRIWVNIGNINSHDIVKSSKEIKEALDNNPSLSALYENTISIVWYDTNNLPDIEFKIRTGRSMILCVFINKQYTQIIDDIIELRRNCGKFPIYFIGCTDLGILMDICSLCLQYDIHNYALFNIETQSTPLFQNTICLREKFPNLVIGVTYSSKNMTSLFDSPNIVYYYIKNILNSFNFLLSPGHYFKTDLSIYGGIGYHIHNNEFMQMFVLSTQCFYQNNFYFTEYIPFAENTPVIIKEWKCDNCGSLNNESKMKFTKFDKEFCSIKCLKLCTTAG